MEKKIGKINFLRLTTVLFVITSLIHVFYAAFTWRGLYSDGGYWMIQMLDALAENDYSVIYANIRARYVPLYLMQLPVWICNLVGLNSKEILTTVFCFAQFFIPLLMLLWSWHLAKRTEKFNVFFWYLFTYCLFLLPFSIFSLVEILIGAGFTFLLWNYLAADIDYKTSDIAIIIFLLIGAATTYEYAVFVGILIFLFHFKYLKTAAGKKQKIVKSLIGTGSLLSALFIVVYSLNVPSIPGEAMRFWGEATDYFKFAYKLCGLYTIIALVLLVFSKILKSKYNNIFLFVCFGIFISAAAYLYLYVGMTESVSPVWEQHMRTMPCAIIPLLVIIMFVFDKKTLPDSYKTALCIVLTCGIMQNCHQMLDTYFWTKNINYMKKELAEERGTLYLPANHEVLSAFFDKNMRRYIWHSAYTFTGILFSDDYKVKTFLMPYDAEYEPNNLVFREGLYKASENELAIPYEGVKISIKNKYWDLSDCADAIDEYNKKNNIVTLKTE